MVQHVSGPTHRLGHTLDLIAIFSQYQPTDVRINPAGIVSDHALIVCHLPARTMSSCPTSTRTVRSWKNVDQAVLRQAITDSPIGRPPSSATAAEMFDIYDVALRDIADRLAPSHVVTTRNCPLTPWFDADCRLIRRDSRRLERRYRRTKTDEDRLAWTQAVKRTNVDFQEKKDAYWRARLTGDSRNSSKLWKSVSKILRRDKNTRSHRPPTITASSFASFFEQKIASIRSNTEGIPPPEILTLTTTKFGEFKQCSELEVRRAIMTYPTKSCILYPLPTSILKDMLDVLLPFLTALINISLRDGNLPCSQKHALLHLC
jgi:hypothetical protein